MFDMKNKLKRFINGNLKKFGLVISKRKPTIVEISKEEELMIKISKKYSMTTEIRMWALLNSLKKIYNEKIDGDIVECGIWKGGNIILIKKFLDKNKQNKKIYCYDTFEGMKQTLSVDSEISTGKSADEIITNNKVYLCESSLEETKKNIRENVESFDNINFIKGKVEDTLIEEKNLPEKISICRLDTDYYESTKVELQILYPRLEKGGVLIVDDYGHWAGSKKAIDEYFKDTHVMKHYVDYACRLIVKP